jgi:tetratricopeptide (TPR) repeat protein
MKPGTACFLLLALALVAYGNSFEAGFVLDNRPVILDNPRLREPWSAAMRQIARTEYWWPFAGQGLYRPLTLLSYWVNYRLLGNGERPFGYHVVNLLLHSFNAMLAYALVLKLTARHRFAAFVAGAMFALHPIATEAVTNIVGRADLLATLGVVGGLLAYIRAQSTAGWRRTAWLGVVIVAYAVGLFSKENAVVLPAVMLLYDLAFHRRPRVMAGYVAMVLVLLAWLAARRVVLTHNPVLPFTAADYIDNALLKGDAWTSRLTAVKIVGKYLWLLVWPATLSADYSYDQIPLVHWPLQSWEDGKAILAAGLIVAALLLAARDWRRQPVVSFFILVFFVVLAPASNFFFLCGSTMAERFLYLPAVAFAGLAGWIMAALWNRKPRVAAVAAGLVLLACGVRTYVRNEDWRDDLGFWVKLVKTSPRSYRAHAGLAAAVINHDPEHRYIDAAVASTKRALTIAPDAVSVQINAGQVYRVKGDTLATRDAQSEMQQTPASAYWYQQSLAALQNAAALVSTQSAATRTGQGDAVININESSVHDEIGKTWLRLGNPAAAIDAFRLARRANPASAAIYLRLADALFAAGQPAGAAHSYWQALFITANRAAAEKALSAIYAQDCPQLSPNCPRIHRDICAAHAEMAQLLDEAGQHAAARQAREHAAADYHCLP